jgi:hypothetical protein
MRVYSGVWQHMQRFRLSFANNRSARNRLTVRWIGRTIETHAVPFPIGFRFIRLLLSGHQTVAIENAALLLQLLAFEPNRNPVLTTFDGCFGLRCEIRDLKRETNAR